VGSFTPVSHYSHCYRTRITFSWRREYLSPLPEIKPRFLHLKAPSINGQRGGSPELCQRNNEWHFPSCPRGWETRFRNKTPRRHIFVSHQSYRSRDSAVGIMTDHRLDDRSVGVRVPVGSRIFPSPRRPDRLCPAPSLLSNGYWRNFPSGQSSLGVKLTTKLQLVPRSRSGSLHPLPHTPSWRSA
jgi:hypothetical protein